jgi:hypothetical protein
METPNKLEEVAGEREAVEIGDREYGGENVVVVDFGPAADEPPVDIVDDTAIVVVDGTQFEFEVPENASDVTVNGGILTITEEK